MIKRFKKLVGIGLLAISLTLSGVTTTVRALDINGDVTTEQALDAGNNKLDTATVEDKITIKGDGKITVVDGEKATLDLNGRTLAIEKDLAIELEGVGTELTIIDSSDPKTGKIICGFEVKTCLSVGRSQKLILNGVTIEAENDAIKNIAGELEIIGSKITSTEGRAIIVSNEYDADEGKDYGSITTISNSSLITSEENNIYIDRQYDDEDEVEEKDKAENSVTINWDEGKSNLTASGPNFGFTDINLIGILDNITINNIKKDTAKNFILNSDQAFKDIKNDDGSAEERDYLVVRRADVSAYNELLDELKKILADINSGKYSGSSVDNFLKFLGLYTEDDESWWYNEDGPLADFFDSNNNFLIDDETNQEKLKGVVDNARKLLDEAKFLLEKVAVPTPVVATPVPETPVPVEEPVYRYVVEEIEPEKEEEAPIEAKKAKLETKKTEEPKKSNQIYFIIGAILLIGLVGWRVFLNRKQTEA